MAMKVETWERPHIRRFGWFFFLAGMAGTAAIVMTVLLFRWLNWGDFNGFGSFVMLPWALAGGWFVSISFHAGVERERQRARQEP